MWPFIYPVVVKCKTFVTFVPFAPFALPGGHFKLVVQATQPQAPEVSQPSIVEVPASLSGCSGQVCWPGGATLSCLSVPPMYKCSHAIHTRRKADHQACHHVIYFIPLSHAIYSFEPAFNAVVSHCSFSHYFA